MTPEEVPTTQKAKKEANKEYSALQLMPAEATKTVRGLVNRTVFWGGHILMGGILIGLVVRIFHLLVPDSWHWLTESNLKEIDHILLGLLTGFAARFWPSLDKNESTK